MACEAYLFTKQQMQNCSTAEDCEACGRSVELDNPDLADANLHKHKAVLGRLL